MGKPTKPDDTITKIEKGVASVIAMPLYLLKAASDAKKTVAKAWEQESAFKPNGELTEKAKRQEELKEKKQNSHWTPGGG